MTYSLALFAQHTNVFRTISCWRLFDYFVCQSYTLHTHDEKKLSCDGVDEKIQKEKNIRQTRKKLFAISSKRCYYYISSHYICVHLHTEFNAGYSVGMSNTWYITYSHIHVHIVVIFFSLLFFFVIIRLLCMALMACYQHRHDILTHLL